MRRLRGLGGLGQVRLVGRVGQVGRVRLVGQGENYELGISCKLAPVGGNVYENTLNNLRDKFKKKECLH